MSTDDARGSGGLIARAVRRDADAWEEIYRAAYPKLFAYARRRLPSDAAADDAVSETMTRAIEGIRRFRPRGAGFDAWLVAITRNVVREHRRQSGRAGVADPDAVEAAAGPADTAASVEERARAEEIRRAFAQLGDDDRDVLEFRVVHEFSAEETGRVIGKRPGAIRMAQKRALERLRAIVEGGTE